MYILTTHVKKDRIDRYMNIKSFIGLGKIVATTHDRDACQALTDTGVILILNHQKTVLVTCYVATMGQAIKLWKGAHQQNKLPRWLYVKVNKNQKLVEQMRKENMII